MEREQYDRVKELFLEACEQPEADRRDFVDRKCGRDPDLRAAVIALLTFDEGDDLSPPAPSPVDGPAERGARFSAGDVFADRYRIVASLGRGGMGEVYHANDLTLDVPVALKFPHVTDAVHRRQILDEVRLARSVTHPAVARIYDIGTQHDEYFVSMEYIPGDDLGALLKRVGRMPPERVMEIGYSLCQGLAAAHEAGVLHRDIKPSNILIDGAGDPKLIDFGIATSLAERSAALAGTPSYMAPEQLSGGALTERTDLWSVGAVLYEMCTGRRPFDGTNLDEIREAHRSPLAPPSALGVSLDPALEAAVVGALAVEPAMRPRAAAELAKRLEGGRRALEGRGARLSSPSSREPERRQLTVLHCEVTDADGRMDELDPEDLRAFSEVARREFERAAARYEATLSDDQELEATLQFGYPVAHEDAAIRAILAGLEIRERLASRLRSLDTRNGTACRVRQGVHVGSAVVASSATTGDKPRLTGSVVRVARQLVQQVSSSELLVSAEARRLLRDRFETRPLPPSANQDVHVVLRARSLERQRSEGISAAAPFVGREEELALIRERIRRAESGRGQILFVSGDGGVGKSRILREVRRGLRSNDIEWRQASCSPYMQNTAFQPFVDLIRSDPVLDSGGDPQEAANLFDREAADRELDAIARHRIAELVSLPLPRPSGIGDVAPDARRDQVIGALAGWLLRTNDGRLPVVVVEDLHWADPSTVDLLEHLAEAVASEAAIVIATHRPEWSPIWPGRSHGTTVSLSPLTSEQAADLVRNVGAATLDLDAIDRIVRRADGIPLFVEELAKHASDQDSTEVPETLRDTLIARLDRMGDAKPVAQCAAVLGRDFDLDVLVSISDQSREEIVDSLDELVREDFLSRTRRGSDVTYGFRHALLRDAAYSSLIRERRVALHSLALDVLRSDGVTAEQHPELLAVHAEFAGREPLILEFRQRAAVRAGNRLAYREAVAHASRALEALSWQPSTRDRDVMELDLQTLLAVSLLVVEGFGSTVTVRAFERARELCAEVGDAARQMPILYGIFSFHEARADSKALSVADDMAKVAAAAGDRVLENVGRASQGHFRLWNGEVEKCRDVLRQVWQVEDQELQRALASQFGDDPIVCSPASLAAAQCALGDVVEGRRTLRTAVERAEALGHPMTLAAVLTFTALGAQILDDLDLCDELVRRNETVCAEGGFPSWGTAALAQRGWIEIRRGEPAAGIAKVESAIARSAAIGQRLFLQGMQVFVAEGELALGRYEDAVAAADIGIQAVDDSHERLWLPELHRVRGDTLVRLARSAEAEESFRRAIDVARQQSAVILELRAARGLARLLIHEGSSDAARACLEEPLAHVSDRAISSDILRARELLGQI